MAVVDLPATHDDHADHGEFIAHHFDSAEQQYDSGKIGIWIFLVTEVLFFSGLFVLYTYYRMLHPEIFEQAHVYLDKILGGLNTVVLLFSSLTMALAVRSAQLGRSKHTAMFTLATMVCAAMFLGVKAVEYSHKWDMGIFVRKWFHLHAASHHSSTAIGQWLGVSDYLVYLSIIPAVLLILFVLWSLLGKYTDKPNLAKFMAGMAFVVGGYFLGAIGAQFYMHATEGGTGGAHAQTASVVAMADHSTDSDAAGKDSDAGDDHVASKSDSGAADDVSASTEEGSGGTHAASSDELAEDLDQDVGIFFSIYYVMTGIHAIHIIAGILFLSWIFWRSIRGHWRPDYFGPVDYVGLYWHLVDLIWIYLFPLLYLID